MKKFSVDKYALDIARKVISSGEISDIEAINQSIESILMTGFNERVFESYGSFVPTLVFNNINESKASGIMEKIISLITKRETRISIVPSMCSITVVRATATMDILLSYIVISSGTVGEFNKRLIF